MRALFAVLHLFQVAEKEEEANRGSDGKSDQAIHDGPL
jgi:hypothetical protein